MWRLHARKCEIVKDSVILLEQLRTIDKTRLRDRVCHLDESVLKRVDHALMVSLELPTSTGYLTNGREDDIYY